MKYIPQTQDELNLTNFLNRQCLKRGYVLERQYLSEVVKVYKFTDNDPLSGKDAPPTEFQNLFEAFEYCLDQPIDPECVAWMNAIATGWKDFESQDGAR